MKKAKIYQIVNGTSPVYSGLKLIYTVEYESSLVSGDVNQIIYFFNSKSDSDRVIPSFICSLNNVFIEFDV